MSLRGFNFSETYNVTNIRRCNDHAKNIEFRYKIKRTKKYRVYSLKKGKSQFRKSGIFVRENVRKDIYSRN